MQAEVKDAYWKIFCTSTPASWPSGPQLIEIIGAHAGQVSARGVLLRPRTCRTPWKWEYRIRFVQPAQRLQVDRAVHGAFGADHPNPGAVVARGLIGDDLGDVQAGERQAGPGPFQGHVRGVVRADEEVGTGAGESVRAHRQGRPH
jgi:hypothetical protein